METKYFKSGNTYWLREVSNIEDPLEPAVYTVGFSPKEGFYLSKTSEKFHIGHKIYGMETAFVERVKKSYEAMTGNLGILLNGIKGTGKTVTSKLVANNMGLPVLVVPQAYEGLQEYISQIPYDVVLFFDEFEKMYPANHENNADILTVMDGVLSNQHRRVFILTTNKTYINENLLERPGRIRYHKEYKDLPREVIEEVVDDLLEHKQFRNEIIEFVSILETITIDIIKNIVQEVNIHNEGPTVFGSFFNIKKSDKNYNIFEVDEKGNKEEYWNDCVISKIDKHKSNQRLYIDGEFDGNIQTILESKNGSYLVEMINSNNPKSKDGKHIPYILSIEQKDNTHSSFRGLF